jgi:hypothetical protein
MTRDVHNEAFENHLILEGVSPPNSAVQNQAVTAPASGRFLERLWSEQAEVEGGGTSKFSVSEGGLGVRT